MTMIDCEDRIRSHMELCLAIQLNEAMTAKNGPQWFDQLVKEDAAVRAVDKDKAVLQVRHKKLEDCDFQAICKILCFREAYRLATFPKSSPKEDSKRLALLYNVLDFRNAALAHKKVLAPKTFAVGEYSYDNAILDMMSLLRIFQNVTGPAPKPKDRPDAEDVIVCYYDEAKKIFEQYKKENGQVDYPVAEAIATAGLKVTEEEFVKACNQLGLDTFCPKGGGWHFSSKEPEKDIQHIREYFKQKNLATELSNEKMKAQKSEREAKEKAHQMEKKSKESTRTVLLLIVVIVAVSLMALLLWGITRSIGDGNEASQSTSQQAPDIDAPSQEERIQEEIDNFASDGLNTFDLKVGQTHKPASAIWLNNGHGSCYSTDANVVTVAGNGAVTAVGEGEAFVVYEAGTGSMYAVYKYIVAGVYQTQEELIQEEMDNFAPDSFNDFQLKVGQTHSPTSSAWLSGGSGSCYSTDTNVVTIAANGTVTAVGEGQAFVVIKAGGGNMYTVLRYTVQGTYKTEDQLIQQEIDNFVPDSFNDITLRVGATHKHNSAVWLMGGTGSCYSTDPEVVSVAEDGLVTAVGPGEAFVVIKAGGSMHSIIRYTVTG